MKRNGFSIVELIAVFSLIGILLILSIPAFLKVFTSVKRDNYLNKIKNIEAAAYEYGTSIKDEIKYKFDINKNSNDVFVAISVPDLIKKGYLESEDKYKDVIINPADGLALDGNVYIRYCDYNFDIKASYAKEFDPNNRYYRDEKVIYNGIMYTCLSDYPDLPLEENGNPNTIRKIRRNEKYLYNNNGINSTYKIYGFSDDEFKYFQKITCSVGDE